MKELTTQFAVQVEAVVITLEETKALKLTNERDSKLHQSGLATPMVVVNMPKMMKPTLGMKQR